MKGLNLPLRTKLHVGWTVALLLGFIVGGIFSHRVSGVAGIVLLGVTFGILYLLGLITINMHLLIVTLQRQLSQTKKTVTHIAGTVGRAAPLIRDLNARVRELEPLRNSHITHEPKVVDTTITTDETLLHEAAEVVLFRAGLTQSVRASLEQLATGSDVLVITNASWPATAKKLRLSIGHEITAVSPADLSHTSPAIAARTRVIILDKPYLQEVVNNHPKWLAAYFRWAPAQRGVYFVDSSSDHIPKATNEVLNKYPCFVVQKNGVEVVFPLKVRPGHDENG